jgi:YidC/Oxa1 family membrane protein insertase
LDSKRLLLATLLSVAVLILWQRLFPPPEPQPRPVGQTVESQPEVSPAAPAVPQAGPVGAQPRAGSPTESAPAAAAESAPAAAAESATEPIAATTEERVTLEGDSFEAIFTNRGGSLVSLLLKEHAAASGEAVDLVRRRQDYPLPLAITDRRGGGDPLDQALFAVERERTRLGPAVTFRYAGPAGEASKRFTLTGGGRIRLEVDVPGRTDWGLLLGPGIRNPSKAETESRFLLRTVIYRQGEETERINAGKQDDPILLPAGGLSWIGLQDTYFLSALLPEGGLDQVLVQPLIQTADGTVRQPGEGDVGDDETEVLALVVQPESSRLVADSYWGAKEYDRIKALGRGLEETVALGWFRFLSLPLLRALRWLHDNVVANYGWAIVLLTIGIRIVLFPLMHKSTVSMQKMQELNPKIQAIRAKYRSKLKDKQGRPNSEAQRKMNEEVMALYKSEGVNPAGGCLPLLLQMPVLFAFYRLLSAAIELRQAPWLGWIQDLSAPDPYYILPIVMGASQFLQQKLTPSAADPMQRRIFALMPIFFTFLFMGFPSGLVLYWLTNNLLGIAQQVAYKKLRPAPATAGAGKGGAGAKKK